MELVKMNKRKFRLCGYLFYIVGILALTLLLSGCQSKQVTAPAVPTDKLTVAVTIVPQATFVQQVGGDLVDVVTLVPPGASPENYSPSPQQMMQFSDAQVYFLIGVPVEDTKILPQIKSLQPGIKLVDLPALVDQKYAPATFPSGERDFHMWMSPKRVEEIVRITANELSALDPAHEAVYQSNAAAYINQLAQLDREIHMTLADPPSRTFIIYHPSLGYFADDYSLTMVALEEEGKEAKALDLEKIIDLAKAEGIKVVFYQAEIDSKQSRTLAAEIGGQAKMISPLNADYINNLRQIAGTFAQVLNQ